MVQTHPIVSFFFNLLVDADARLTLRTSRVRTCDAVCHVYMHPCRSPTSYRARGQHERDGTLFLSLSLFIFLFFLFSVLLSPCSFPFFLSSDVTHHKHSVASRVPCVTRVPTWEVLEGNNDTPMGCHAVVFLAQYVHEKAFTCTSLWVASGLCVTRT